MKLWHILLIVALALLVRPLVAMAATLLWLGAGVVLLFLFPPVGAIVLALWVNARFGGILRRE